jgi:hypothetical protein
VGSISCRVFQRLCALDLPDPALPLHLSCFAVEEIEPWDEDGELWRRLKVIFPDNSASHTRTQVSYFGPDGLLRRHDYAVDVLGGAKGAHYIGDYHDHGGIVMPHRRRV